MADDCDYGGDDEDDDEDDCTPMTSEELKANYAHIIEQTEALMGEDLRRLHSSAIRFMKFMELGEVPTTIMANELWMMHKRSGEWLEHYQKNLMHRMVKAMER